MTVTAEQAKALADHAISWTCRDLAATVVGLWERLATVEAELIQKRDWINAQGAEMAKLHDAYGMVEAERDLGRERSEWLNDQCLKHRSKIDALQGAIDKVLALHTEHYYHVDSDGFEMHPPCCAVCDEEEPCLTVQALTQGGEG